MKKWECQQKRTQKERNRNSEWNENCNSQEKTPSNWKKNPWTWRYIIWII